MSEQPIYPDAVRCVVAIDCNNKLCCHHDWHERDSFRKDKDPCREGFCRFLGRRIMCTRFPKVRSRLDEILNV